MKGYILGAGPQGRISAEVWRQLTPQIEPIFLDDDASLHGRRIAGIEVAGGVASLATRAASVDAVVAIGANRTRLKVADDCSAPSVHWATLVHPSAVVMPSAEVAEGTVVLAQALVSTGAVVGKHVLINSAAIVEHDSVVEDGASLGPGVATGGRVHIGRAAFISTGVTIAPRLSIGAGTIVGAGAVVVEDLPEGVLAYGAPARVIRELTPEDLRRVL
jgi:acetyltransferase EpsM